MESETNSKSEKEEKPQVPLSASLPLSGTQEHPLAPLRGESAAEGRFDHALVLLSGSLPLSGEEQAQGSGVGVGEVPAMDDDDDEFEDVEDDREEKDSDDSMGCSLVTNLCDAAGIDVSRLPLESPRKELDVAYFTHYCVVDEPGQPAPPQQPRTH
ncbi:hypothetical protein LR48_Vigan965s000300 [Vigna angularis]|uniref:Uncharacterized protein n=1 Tax=Phaseolus angularis TaxID=3914 RepID=A0A0L9THN3_PHAAN|nr:hypothetical protein LR48_Vigan965s000300 [Vigna angularis]